MKRFMVFTALLGVAQVCAKDQDQDRHVGKIYLHNSLPVSKYSDVTFYLGSCDDVRVGKINQSDVVNIGTWKGTDYHYIYESASDKSHYILVPIGDKFKKVIIPESNKCVYGYTAQGGTAYKTRKGGLSGALDQGIDTSAENHYYIFEGDVI